MSTVVMSDAAASQTSRPRIHAVDGLRGLFAIGVMLHHYVMWFGVPVNGYVDGFLTKIGIYAVSGFFVISGASLYHVYRGPMTNALVREFYLRRFLRIAPLYYVTCVVDMLGHYALGHPYLGYEAGRSSRTSPCRISRWYLGSTVPATPRW